MIETKLFEILDRNTFIPAIASRVSHADGALARYAGYESPCVLLTYLVGRRQANHDPYAWGDRTMTAAHLFITEKWEELRDGAVVDVEYIRGETRALKKSCL